MKEGLNKLILYANEHKATDIHFHVTDGKCECFMRTLKGLEKIEWEDLIALYEYLKYRSNCDLGSLNQPQSASFQLLINNKKFFMRYSLIETLSSSTGVLRILKQPYEFTIQDLSYKVKQRKIFQKWCQMRSGCILMSGPTGSGKTTTINTLLENIYQQGQFKIMTLEDPIEIINEHFVQIQINEKNHLSMEEGIKHILRHDPDVILVGEIRDAQTAKWVFRCALSGHLVFSSIHAKSASEALKRLCDFGLSKDNLIDSLTAITNQRLYSDSKGKERVCIYEIMEKKELSHLLNGKQLPKGYKTIFDEIKEAVDKRKIKASEARKDLLDE